MPGQCRTGHLSTVPIDVHGGLCCPHVAIGPATKGSPDVLVNGAPALRVTDIGGHAACCGFNTWVAAAGSGTVFINGLAAHRKGDADTHCGGVGFMKDGSENVMTGG
jgi:uncharacterized Zn-binding protein involved in type VI secretion